RLSRSCDDSPLAPSLTKRIPSKKIVLDWTIRLSDNHTIDLTAVNPLGGVFRSISAGDRDRARTSGGSKMKCIRRDPCLAALVTSGAAPAQHMFDVAARTGVRS